MNQLAVAFMGLDHLLHHLPTSAQKLLLLDGDSYASASFLQIGNIHTTAIGSFTEGEFAQFPTTVRKSIRPVSFCKYLASTDRFPACIFINYSPSIHPLDLFDKLSDVIEIGGIVVLSGNSESSQSPRLEHWVSHISSIALRCGFTLTLSEGVDGEAKGQAFVLRYCKSKSPRWKLSHARDDDFAGIASLFQNVFGRPLSRELWNWKYGGGQGNAVIAKSNGEIVAHYGGMYRDVMRCGSPYWVFQACDVMVKESERGILTRQGPFFLTAATTAEIYGPPAYGFPTARHTLVTTKLGLSVEVGKMVELRWKAGLPLPSPSTTARAINQLDTGQHYRVNQLWDAMANDLKDAVIGIRNWEYIKRRYIDHPHNRYHVIGVNHRFRKEAIGLIVLKRHEDCSELLELVGPIDNFPILIDHAKRITARWKLAFLYYWITENFSNLPVFSNAQRNTLDMSVLTSCWTPDAHVEYYKDRWWLTSGDTDFR